MTILKKLILSLMILSSTSLFAAGFDTPMEAFNFYYNLAVKSAAYNEKYGTYKKEYINALAPHIWSKRNPPDRARIVLSQHRGWLMGSRQLYKQYPLTVNMKHSKAIYGRDYKKHGTVEVYYSHYEFQDKENDRRIFETRAKKVGNKMKWFII